MTTQETTMTEPTMTTESAAALRKPFPPEAIGKLPRGKVFLDYVGHAAVTDRLLQVDPLWSWEPFAVNAQGLPALDEDGSLWIRLTICGVTRIGVGDSSNGKGRKELIGDAIRNGAMRFGVALDLWSKEDLSDMEGNQRVSEETLNGLRARLGSCTPEQAARGKDLWVRAGLPALNDLRERHVDIVSGIIDTVLDEPAGQQAFDTPEPDGQS
jgi:hypothetical protein